MMRGEARPEPATMVPDEPTSETIWQDAYRRERGALLAFLRRLVRDGGLAEDLLQETFVRAIRAGRAGADPERLRSYLFTIARNLAADHFRRPRLLSLEGPAAEGEERTGFDPEDHA
ncbi:MAG: sigma-70 family RNA polymerase sigma factor, partial [Thermoanaerobaculia bacterium]|nr:sigma-70 family RNA polymerase sigma factor [Thermoanaerobaculia bacterium]